MARTIEAKWYAVRTVAGKEKSAKENIEREIDLNSIDKWVGEIILPTEKLYKLKNGKKYTREKLVMPGYLFVELQLIGEVESIIKNTKNVVGFAGDRNRKPQPLKDHEIDRIVGNMKKVEEGEGEIPFIVDEKVTVIDGPFNGFNGEVSSVDHDKQSLVVSVKIFGRETPVKLSYLQVDKYREGNG
ncbi:MAG: NusG antitermination factor [uncultured marine phage]|uniref:NusG antitermination factor n=1 Tax=uncultured marine phage TaxID=707152 RepID=A0A8D9C8G4_9VIRU|nr:MAG: NusG antitermination factor [uncultured marine phage]